ncbi:hypothetical protein PI125_g21520 [Phytophthora idaei]|nr:hypothetical protein PI125_g21520 [Phytophthora idaei]KAG3130808.1 hypothetical protein PI126_g20333 [Phytophthora idaei]
MLQQLQQMNQMNQMMLKQQQGSGTHRGFVNAVAPTAPQSSGAPTSGGTLTRTLDHLISVLDLTFEPRKERLSVVDVGARAAVARIVRVREAAVIGASATATIPWSATGRGLKAILETGNVAFLSVTSASRRARQWQCVRTLASYEGWRGTLQTLERPRHLERPNNEGEGSVAPSSCLVGDTKRDEGSREKGMASGPERTLGRGVMNGEDARDVPVASVTTKIAETELGTIIGSGPTERTGFEQDGRTVDSTRRLDQEGAGTEEATERSKVTLDWEGGTKERSQVIRNANRGATKRSEAALTPKDECKKGKEAEVPPASSARYKNALKSNTEDASSVREGRFSAVIGMAGASKVETEALEVENDEKSSKGTASTSCYDRRFTDEELNMLERGGDQVVKDEPEEY